MHSPSPPSSGDDEPPPPKTSTPAAASATSLRGAIAHYKPQLVALCCLIGILVGWVYYGGGGGGGLRPQEPPTMKNRGSEGGLFRLGDAGRRLSDSGEGGGGGESGVGEGAEGGGTAKPGLREPQLEVVEEENEPILPDGGGAGGGDGSLARRYDSFEEFASEQYEKIERNETLAVPIVTSHDGGPRSTPVGIIIGVQKGGTQNLRSHLLTHPLLSGQPGKEAHFFDSDMFRTSIKHGIEWPGDDHDGDRLSPHAVGDILRGYAIRNMAAMAPEDRETLMGVDSSPVYIFHPLVPYRINMVLPRAKFVLLLRDPTERYFSHLRMTMCWTKQGESFESAEKRLRTYFHNPGPENAKEYLKNGEARYQPYTARCRGEKATAGDLKRCWDSLQVNNPLHRGLYADQLERWYRVFDRDQIMIIESGEMFADFTGTLDRAAHHLGLPPHDFEYNAKHQHASSGCEQRRPELFAKGARYDKMLKDAEYFQDWYRPHNQRLFKLIGRDMPWS